MYLLFDPESLISISLDSGATIVEKESIPGTLTINRHELLLFQSEIYVLDSIRSGLGGRTKETGAYGRLLKPVLDALSISHHYESTRSRDSITTFAANLKPTGKPILVIIAGGDTSVAEFVNGLDAGQKGEIHVATIPEGTGNALTLSNGSKDENEAVWRVLTALKSKKVPFQLYTAEFPPESVILHHDGFKEPVKKLLFVVVTSWAFHASLVADSDSDEMRKNGISRFKIAAEANLGRPQRYSGSLAISDQSKTKRRLQGPLAYVVVTPAQRFEPNFVILPKGDIHDSDLYVVGFRTEDSDSYIMDIMKEIYENGSHVANPKVFYEKVNASETVHLSLEENLSAEERRFCVDGAIVVVPGSVESAVDIYFHGSQVGDWMLYLV